MGTDRIALDRFLHLRGMRDRIGPSWFVEANRTLSGAVGRLWARARAEDPAIAPYTSLCDDVWDLLDPTCPAAATLAREIPARALLLIVAGSPCQGLTVGGPTRGRAGVASLASSPLVAVLATWHILHALRPDLEIHLLIENAGSMTEESRSWIVEAMNISPLQAPTTDAGLWTGFTRRRTFFSTLPPTSALNIPTRPIPWDDGWGRRHRAPLPPMQRSRGPGPRASTYQYAAHHLLYRLDEAWLRVPASCLHIEVGRLLPPALQAAWRLLILNPQGWEAERRMEPVAAWLATHGEALGARGPNTAERGRAAGLFDLCQGLRAQGLSNVELFDAQGNAFDVDACRSRIQEPILAWLQGAPTPSARPLAPAAVGLHYRRLVDRVSVHDDLRPHIAVIPGPGWLWQEFCSSFAAPEAAPLR